MVECRRRDSASENDFIVALDDFLLLFSSTQEMWSRVVRAGTAMETSSIRVVQKAIVSGSLETVRSDEQAPIVCPPAVSVSVSRMARFVYLRSIWKWFPSSSNGRHRHRLCKLFAHPQVLLGSVYQDP